jgi:GntR family transcriptional regulator
VQLIVSPADELPIYRQIIRQIIEAIAGGKLKSGDQLPSHRDLSEQLVVAPLTVKRAYDELESLGYIETQRGRGTFVRARLPKVNRANQLDGIGRTARHLLSEAYLAGIGFPELVRLLEEAARQISEDQP